ncbi:hypothetical protein GPECTOR_32g476 [Gonium pectorale]|uniref:Uncharacterized protein n=1 Tax=Gonium pectorale TaxID=33097 RepID=A0A150GDL2_GONPE|nr:hypothetical protein GPECTOR_32g476 [Gonium pectorale]|eukprot:KXZ47863.1 hypothetical protein GPECTOR_32g476 [Gonium pectorale]
MCHHSPAQRQQLPQLLSALQRPGAAAQRLAALASLSVSYRDLSVLLCALDAREADRDPLLEPDPRVSASMAAAASELDQLGNLSARSTSTTASPASSSTPTTPSSSLSSSASAKPRRGTYLPLRDVTLIPDDKQVDGRSDAPEELRYSPTHMDKISCWAATQPTHIELSQQLQTGVKLFPPTEATYPTYVDFDAAMRLLAHHRSRKRMRLQRRLMRKQDKYQLKTWEHHPGEV